MCTLVQMCCTELHFHFNFICLFTGDIGGYMGLFLGASIVTVCEIFDVVIYNALRKLKCRHSNVEINTADTAL